MTNPLAGLEPSNLWKYFAEISAIPRQSGEEKLAVDYLENLAKEKGLEYHRDKTGNIIIRIPASKGYEDSPTVVLQGHIDMVCVKDPGFDHDFTSKGINLIIDGDWVRGDHTTLGADNAIGVAAGLAMIDEKDAIHPPLEILVTVDEETGMTGAINIDSQMVKGRKLINLDSENPEVIYVGCAGGGDSVIRLSIPRETAPKGTALKLSISGLAGGHSGMDIALNRGNAIKILARILYHSRKLGVKILTIKGGVRRNVIPSTAEADIIIKPGTVKRFREIVGEIERQTREEYYTKDTGMKIEILESNTKEKEVIKTGAANKLIRLLMALPYGVLAMSQEMEGLVETSNNVGILEDLVEYVSIVATTRSSIDSARKRIQDEIASACALAGADVKIEHIYPGWKPNLASPLLKLAKDVYVPMFNRQPKIIAIHAGLETGFFGERFPGVDMISFGPRVEGAHSTKERVNVTSTGEFFKFLKGILERLALKQ